ncbi:Sporozoite antigen [Eimeria tenella]|uniref:Sporozoite antigen n=3 Tax=Eimeria tenella TaxID=5802 RepID=ANSP_EIMTE|nr:Sporozoite antigen [Eimeria tenella]P15744.2 RecName: Full=Sporozoite antigen [Eimeria tenella]CDJ44154.1 Sporozoite antigen [Eimeria tenella]|eukprot:XP_013234903.1 Sporozoite antigen [Eimeria tenella]
MADLFSGLVGGVVGAVAAADLPAEGERAPRPAPGTAWTCCCSKLQEGARELEGFVQQLSFVAGKLACCLRVGAEQLARCAAEGRLPSSSSSSSCCALLQLEKQDLEQSLEAGKQGAECLLRSSKLALEALLEGARVAATRGLLLVESSKDTVLRSIPHTQEKLAQAYSSFLRGYQGAAAGRSLGYGAPAAAYGQQQQPSSYGAPPASSQQPSGFFW